MEPARPTAEPEPAPTDDPPGSGWVVPPRDAPRGASSGVLAAVLWIVAIAFAGFRAVTAYDDAAGTDSFRAGVATGTFVGPFLISAILRVVVMSIRSRRLDTGSLRSHWVPLGAIVIAVLSMLGSG